MNAQPFDPATGEILPAQGGRAADGGVIPHAAMTGGQFLDLLGDGEVGSEMHVKLTELAAAMHDVNRQTGKLTKGKLTITVDLSLEDGAFRIASDVKTKAPELPKPRSICWTDEHNRFTRFPPNQGQFFGVRAVGGTGGGPRAV